MNRGGILVLLTLLFSFVSKSKQQPCTNWISVNETEYGQTYVPVTHPDANTTRPLGYMMSTYEFQGVKPCFIVSPTGGNDRKIEVAWEMEKSGTLCFAAQKTNVKKCSTGVTDSTCGIVPGSTDSVTYEFDCEGVGCEGGIKYFWFRFVVESPRADGSYDENWCDNRDLRFPSSLKQIPTNLPPPTTTATTSSSNRVFANPLSLFVLALLMNTLTCCLNI